MKLIEVTEQAGWNEYIAKSPFGDILQTWEWGEVKKNELWRVLRARVEDGGKIVGQMQVLTRKMPLGMVLYYSPRGPVLDYRADTARQIMKILLDWAKKHAEAHKGLMVKIGPAIPQDQLPRLSDGLAKLGLKSSFRSVQMQHTRIIDLAQTEMDLLLSFDKDTRNLVRRAAKEGVIVDKADTAEDLKSLRAFHNMYAITAERGKFPPRPWEQFTKLWELMAPKGMMVAYLATFEDQPLAGAIILKIGPRAYYLWGGSRRDTEKKYAPYALQWTVMQDMKAGGVTSYDMWGIPPTDDPKHPWAGPALFKKGFGGSRVDYIGDYDLPISSTYPLFTTAEKVRQKMFGQH